MISGSVVWISASSVKALLRLAGTVTMASCEAVPTYAPRKSVSAMDTSEKVSG